MWLLWILLPILLGFLIGYATNRVAIAMMFRPREPRRILGVTFWGVFPRLQPQFAEQAGELVAREFFNAEALAGHIETMAESPRLQDTMRQLLERELDREWPSARVLLRHWLGSETAATLRTRVSKTIAAKVREQVASEQGRATLASAIVPQLERVLMRPLREILGEIAEQEPPDPSEPQRQREQDRIGRVLGVPQMLRWAAASQLPKELAERAFRLAHQALEERGRLSELLPAQSQARIADWLASGAPTLQRSLAEQLEKGPMRKVIADEMRTAVRRKISSWTSPVPVLGNLINSERLLSLLDGVLDRLPEELAAVLRSPGTERTLRSLLRHTAADVLRNEPRQFLQALDETLHPQVIEWLGERLAAGLNSPEVVAEVDDVLHESLRQPLDEPAGLWLARVWKGGSEAGGESQAGPPETETPEASVRRVANRAVWRWLNRLDEEALERDVHTFAESLVEQLLQRPLGRPRAWLPLLGADGASIVELLSQRMSVALVDTVRAHLPEVLDALDIRELVRANIADWEPAKLEEAVYEVSKSHLGFVTWFGGFLGAIIGLVQVALQALR